MCHLLQDTHERYIFSDVAQDVKVMLSRWIRKGIALKMLKSEKHNLNVLGNIAEDLLLSFVKYILWKYSGVIGILISKNIKKRQFNHIYTLSSCKDILKSKFSRLRGGHLAFSHFSQFAQGWELHTRLDIIITMLVMNNQHRKKL